EDVLLDVPQPASVSAATEEITRTDNALFMINFPFTSLFIRLYIVYKSLPSGAFALRMDLYIKTTSTTIAL
ncbi:MAG: hypothetical protein Q4B09_10120, partial [Lachnospiraceae bacterium]|nr:hypothetical protein [Lachnospiraceae bacterium]